MDDDASLGRLIPGSGVGGVIAGKVRSSGVEKGGDKCKTKEEAQTLIEQRG